MIFLKLSEYKPYIKTDTLDEIATNNSSGSLLAEIERVAIKKVIGYTARYFKSECLFPTIHIFQDGNVVRDFNDGDYVYDIQTDNIFRIQLNPDRLISDDPRDPLIKQILIDYILYDYHSRISPHQIPELRVERYHEAKNLLENIANGFIHMLPVRCRIKDEDGENEVYYGFNEKINQRPDIGRLPGYTTNPPL